MRVAMEPLTIAAGVDVFFYGESPTGAYLPPFLPVTWELNVFRMSEQPHSTKSCSKLAVSLILLY